MDRKWCLLKASDGGRGDQGKKKVYEVVVTDNVLRCEWGMAEKLSRQSSTKVFMTSQSAVWAAHEKVSAKLGRGYTIAYAV